MGNSNSFGEVFQLRNYVFQLLFFSRYFLCKITSPYKNENFKEQVLLIGNYLIPFLYFKQLYVSRVQLFGEVVKTILNF